MVRSVKRKSEYPTRILRLAGVAGFEPAGSPPLCGELPALRRIEMRGRGFGCAANKRGEQLTLLPFGPSVIMGLEKSPLYQWFADSQQEIFLISCQNSFLE